MKTLKVLAVVLLATFTYSAANAQMHHKPRYRHHRVIKHPIHHRFKH